MSRTIDEKVVSMQFDNREFEKNVQTTMGTVGKLKQSLNFDGATKGLEGISTAARNVDMSGLSSGVEAVRMKFSALQVFAVNALTDIYRTATNAGKRIVSALTIDPIKTGFQEYETQINAVQTILANTESKGTTLEDVNGALDTLNTYADKTIYNFTEMTRNIGTFTAAGVDLDTSVKSIQGIANLAAVSGSTSQQASTAMYQLSQALAAGKVSLMDWNSVVNAGMGGQVFQDALKRTAKVMGKDVDGMIKKYGSFRESLTQGEWLTTDVLTKTLEQFTMSAKKGSKEWNEFKKSLMADGYTEKQAEEILNMANTATNAATKVKTFTQLWDTLKEAAQSGWTQTWEIIVGDFEEAKSLLTSISDTIGAIIGKSAESRNKLLKDWKELGGRNDLLESFKNIYEAIGAIIKPISEAFKEIFPATTAQQLFNITKAIKEFTEKLIIGGETADKIKRTFKGLFSIADMLRKIFVTVGKVIASVFSGGAVTSLGDLILTMTASIGDFFTSLNEGFKMDGIAGGLTTIVGGISNAVSKIAKGIKNLGPTLSKVGDFILNVFKKIGEGISTAFGWIKDNISAGDIFAGLAGGGIFLAGKKLAGLFTKIKDLFDGGLLGLLFGGGGDDGGSEPEGLKKKFGDLMDGVGESLQSFTSGIKVGSLVAIAVAITLLSSSLKKISELKGKDITKSLFAMGTMFSMLTGTFATITKVLSKFPAKGIVKAGVSMILIAKAIDILADAIVELSQLSLEEIGKGLLAVGGGMLELTVGMKILNKVKIPLSTSVAMVVLAKSCGILADALKKFGEMEWDEIGRGLVAMGGALGEMVLVLKAADSFGGFSSLAGSGSIAIVIGSLDELAEALKKFGSMKWDEIGHGLTAMGGALGEVAIVTGALGKFAGFSSIFGGSSIVITVQSLSELADGLKKFGDMDWDTIGHGLVGMGGALTEVAVISGVLGKLTGFSGLLGSIAIVVAVQSLGDLADAFKKFGEMTWDEIKRGLVGMGGALTEVGTVSGVLGYLTNFAGLLGGASIWVAVQGLGDLADAFKKFGEMSWDQIKTGLAAMGSALGELALGGLLNTLSIIGSYSISEVAEPLGVLADSIKKWEDVTVPEHLAGSLTSLAGGIMSFTLSNAGANALATAAPGVGIMADSVKKWVGVAVPEGLGTNLKTLASGIFSFTYSGLGASALSTAAPGVGQMADSVAKWKDVTVPGGLKDDLTDLADGVKSFTYTMVAGWSMSAIDGPLGNLADSVKKWKDVKIPKKLDEHLTNLADGVKSFSFAFLGGWSMSSIAGPLGTMADSVKKWKDVTVSAELTAQLTLLATGIKAFSGIKFKTISSGIDSITKSLKNLDKTAKPAITSSLNAALTEAESYKSKFESAGKSVVDGFANGISINTYKAKAKAVAMAKAAYEAAKEELDVNSPSKVFRKLGTSIPEGFAQGIGKLGDHVSAATKGMTDTSIDGTRKAIARIADTINSDIDTQPTIRPVLDLSRVSSDASKLNGMFGNATIGALSSASAINQMMNRRQNGTNNDVVSAIEKLQDKLGNVGNTYNSINGVTYDDDSRLNNAIQEIVRAAKVERRK